MIEGRGLEAVAIRAQDLDDADAAWELYKATMKDQPRRRLRKRDLIAGYLAGVAAERTRQHVHVHPNIVRAKHLVDFANMRPELFEIMKAQHPDLIQRLRLALEG